MEMETQLKLHSPVVGEDPMRFDWPLYRNKDDYDGAHEIVDTIRHVSEDWPHEIQARMESYIPKKSAWTNISYECMETLCYQYNISLGKVLQLEQGTEKVKQRQVSLQPSHSLLKHVIQQVYNLAITDPKALNKYAPFSPQVYGEASYELVAQMIDQMKIGKNDIFIDLGSGIGQVVLQMAGSTDCQMCYGIEKEDVPSNYAKSMDTYFQKLMKWYGKSHGKYHLEQGDFLDKEFREKIESATIIFVNNFAFGPSLNHQLKGIFADLKDGVRIVSSSSFCPSNFRTTSRNLSDIATILEVQELRPPSGSASWTNTPVPFWIQEISRKKLQEYFERIKHDGRGKDGNVRRKRRANPKANCMTSTANSYTNSSYPIHSDAEMRETDTATLDLQSQIMPKGTGQRPYGRKKKTHLQKKGIDRNQSGTNSKVRRALKCFSLKLLNAEEFRRRVRDSLEVEKKKEQELIGILGLPPPLPNVKYLKLYKGPKNLKKNCMRMATPESKETEGYQSPQLLRT